MTTLPRGQSFCWWDCRYVVYKRSYNLVVDAFIKANEESEETVVDRRPLLIGRRVASPSTLTDFYYCAIWPVRVRFKSYVGLKVHLGRWKCARCKIQSSFSIWLVRAFLNSSPNLSLILFGLIGPFLPIAYLMSFQTVLAFADLLWSEILNRPSVVILKLICLPWSAINSSVQSKTRYCRIQYNATEQRTIGLQYNRIH